MPLSGSQIGILVEMEPSVVEPNAQLLRNVCTEPVLVFYYWTTTDKLKFTDWSEVQRMFGSEEIAIFRQWMIITPSPG